MKQWFMTWAFGIALLFGIPNSLFAEEGNEKIHFHGYGELHYNSPESSSNVPDDEDPAVMDLHRMVWGLDYYWTDQISLHTEVDFEHAAQEMELEYAYIDFLVNPAFNVRAGSVLMPVGPLNEFHEPPLFYSVERPYVQNAIIPTTWQEGGAGIFGSPAEGLKYRLYIVSGLNADGFSASSGIRGGRGKVAEQPSDELAVVGRLEYMGLPGLSLGASGYSGGANTTNNDALEDVAVTILEGDVRYRIAGLDLQGVFVQINVDEAEKLFALDGAEVGEKMVGWYGEVAYHLLGLILPETEKDLVLFVRMEQINTQEEVPDAFDANPANERQVLTYGLAYYPIPQVAVKADFERWENEADNDNEGDRFNLGLAWMFP
jgi:hypothetical protein